jgi:short-subunit dehydrogenase
MKVLITGGSRGIGKAIAEVFSDKASTIIINGISQDNLEKTAEELRLACCSAKIETYKADLTDKKSLEKLVAFIKEQIGGLDILVNNAGCFIPGKISEEPDGVLEKLMNTNLYSAYYLTRGLLPLLKKSKKGHIFNMCSVASILPYENGGAYSITKFALLGFSKCIREELKHDGIRVTSLIPGATYTDSWQSSGLAEERFMKAEDIAEVLFKTYELSQNTNIEEIVLRPMLGDI